MTKRWTKRAWLIGSALSWPLLAAAAQAQTLPSGGSVPAGTATIGAPSAGSLTISQSSARAVIDWTGFSIGSGGTVQFNNGSGATLNRVTGGAASQLDGALNATGSVYLLNPNGVVVGASGVVNVNGGFVASTLDVSNAAFMAGGDLTLEGGSTASVVNLGKIGALGGNLVLAARTVENRGQLLGAASTGLLAGSKVLLSDTAGPDGRLQVLVGSSSDSATNKGFLYGSIAELKANGGNIYALAGDTRGVINAIGFTSDGGRVFLTPGAGGSVTVEDTTITARTSEAGGKVVVGSNDAAGVSFNYYSVIDAAANSGGGAGGQVETSGQTVTTSNNFKVTMKGSGGADGLWKFTSAAGAPAQYALQNAIATGDVTVTSLTGGIALFGILSVSDGHRLTLNSAAGITFPTFTSVRDANSQLILNTGAGFDYGGGPVSFADAASQVLKINGAAYTLISTAAQLQALAGPTPLSGYYALANDIDLASIANFQSLNMTTGIFAGLNHRLYNLHVEIIPGYAPGGGRGLFDTLGGGGTIRDLGLDGGSVTATWGRPGFGVNVGALVGANAGTISNTWSTVSVSGEGLAGGGTGGLVGVNSGSIYNSSAHGVVLGMGPIQRTGGLVGWNAPGATVSNSRATGFVSNLSYGAVVGGLVGQNGTPSDTPSGTYATITNSYALGYVGSYSANLNFAVGGLVGANESGIIRNSYATGTVNGGLGGGAGARIYPLSGGIYPHPGMGGVGGLVGYATDSIITDSYATGMVTSAPSNIGVPYPVRVGGLVGHNSDDTAAATIARSYATGSVAAGGATTAGPSHMVGGLVGLNDGGQITDAYATGAVVGWNGAGYAGGFAGQNTGAITNAYSTGTVGNTGTTGGFVGVNSGTIVRGYWDRDTSKLGNGFGANTGAAGLTALGAAPPFPSPYAQSSYAGFDFVSVWTPPSPGVRPKLR